MSGSIPQAMPRADRMVIMSVAHDELLVHVEAAVVGENGAVHEDGHHEDEAEAQSVKVGPVLCFLQLY